MNKLLALADRVEKLTGPDREVDAEIYAITSEAIDYQRIAIKMSDASRLERWHDGWVTVYGAKGEADPYPEDLARYTSSLDVAKTLVPKGWGWQLSQTGVAGAWLISDGEQPITVDGLTFPGVTAQVGAKAISPALALTCAALRARAHGGGED